MLRGGKSGSRVIQGPYYPVFDLGVKQLARNGRRAFEGFSDNNDNLAALRKANQYFSDAIKLARDLVTNEPEQWRHNLDLSYALRKSASTIIRLPQINHATLASTYKKLSEAIAAYQQYSIDTDNKPTEFSAIIASEWKKALHLQCKIALDMKNGPLLERAVQGLQAHLPSVPQTQSDVAYQYDVHEYEYMIAFARHDFKLAKSKAKACISLAQEHKMRALNFIGQYRHLVKLEFAQLLTHCSSPTRSMDDIQKRFEKEFDKPDSFIWQVIEYHCQAYLWNPDSSAIRKNLLDDFTLLYRLRVFKQQIGLYSDKCPKERTIGMASGKKYFNDDEKALGELENRIDEKIEKINDTQDIRLSYDLFPDESTDGSLQPINSTYKLVHQFPTETKTTTDQGLVDPLTSTINTGKHSNAPGKEVGAMLIHGSIFAKGVENLDTTAGSDSMELN